MDRPTGRGMGGITDGRRAVAARCVRGRRTLAGLRWGLSDGHDHDRRRHVDGRPARSRPRWPRPNAGLYGVSCPTTTFCAAVDGAGNACPVERDPVDRPASGRRPRRHAQLGLVHLADLLRRPQRPARRWSSTGTTWTTTAAVGPAPTGPTGGQYQVSCTSPTFCASVNTAGVASLFDGTTWGHDAQVDDGTADKPVQNVSCASATFCVVVSATGQHRHLQRPSWTRSRRPASRSSTRSRARRTRFCMAVDLTGHAIVWDGSSWSTAAPCRTPAHLTFSVSCPTSGRCLVVRSDGSVSVWQSGAWSAPRTVLRRRHRGRADGQLARPRSARWSTRPARPPPPGLNRSTGTGRRPTPSDQDDRCRPSTSTVTVDPPGSAPRAGPGPAGPRPGAGSPGAAAGRRSRGRSRRGPAAARRPG